MGLFVMVDGIEGAGKGVFMEEARAMFPHFFDLKKYTSEHRKFPELSEIQQDVVFSVEPTFTTVGKAIREEMLNSDYKYSALSTAHAFALDREILYQRMIIPLRKAGKTIIQERGVVSSLVYQPIQLEKLTLRDIVNIQGNHLAVKNAPDFLVIIKADPEQASRHRQKAFESLFFARRIEERFESDWLKSLFERFGTRVLYLDGNCPLPEFRERVRKLLRLYIFGGQTTLASNASSDSS